jgi:glycosyltransferase involved in cell wall biosynthesis
MKKNYKLSIITPFYNEEDGIRDYFDKVLKILKKEKINYEIICVDDGSKDKTFELLQKQHKKDSRIKVLKLSRNFGKESALTAGLDFATGDAIIPIDADLQDPPELIPEMIKKWKEGYKVILMKRKSRNEGFLKKFTANLFYNLVNKISDSSIPKDIGDFRLMDKKVVEVIRRMREKSRFMKGILSWAGFKTEIIYFDRPERFKGKIKQNYKKLIGLALNGIFSFSTLPIRLFTFMGIITSLFAFIYGAYLFFKTVFFGTDLAGYPSIMVAILFFSGVQLLGLGVLGEYIGRVFDETKNRPIYVIEEEIL